MDISYNSIDNTTNIIELIQSIYSRAAINDYFLYGWICQLLMNQIIVWDIQCQKIVNFWHLQTLKVTFWNVLFLAYADIKITLNCQNKMKTELNYSRIKLQQLQLQQLHCSSLKLPRGRRNVRIMMRFFHSPFFPPHPGLHNFFSLNDYRNNNLNNVWTI